MFLEKRAKLRVNIFSASQLLIDDRRFYKTNDRL